MGGGGDCDRARDLRFCSQSAAQRNAELGERDGGHVQMMSFVLIVLHYLRGSLANNYWLGIQSFRTECVVAADVLKKKVTE